MLFTSFIIIGVNTMHVSIVTNDSIVAHATAVRIAYVIFGEK